MRLSEKTIELNFCSQFGQRIGGRVIWFGLTQEQEAHAGFDACTRLGARLIIFQFKASRDVVASGRRFRAKHSQMASLRAQCAARRGIFYVFPLVGTTAELSRNPDILAQSWLLDVFVLPNPPPAPTTRWGSLRKSQLHYVDVAPPNATIHSEPSQVPLINASELLENERREFEAVNMWSKDPFQTFTALRRALRRNAVGAAVLPEGVT